MPSHAVEVHCDVPGSFRVNQVRGIFDLKKAKTAGERFEVELPGLDEDWQIGVVVGPSGSGKTTVARAAYGRDFVAATRWPKGAAVVDGFADELSIKDITATLTSVGFSSPPAWVKPYHVLSGGERFRCDLARALLAPGDLVAFDEFTSVVDRTVAKIGSAAVAKAIRKGRINKRFVAVTCHYDVLDWLEPDWVLDMASCQLARGCLYQRPPIELEVAPVHYSAWLLFRRHHYLNTDLSVGAKCFAAFWGDEPVAFSAWVHALTRGRRAGDMREHRTVVLPDYQGVGIGNRLSEFCASIFTGAGGRALSTTSHPAMIHYRSASSLWRRLRLGRVHRSRSGLVWEKDFKKGRRPNTSCDRYTAGFEYVGPALVDKRASEFLAAAPRLFALSDADQRVFDVVCRLRGTTASSIASRAGLPTKRVYGSLARLEADGRVERFSVGRRVGWRPRDSQLA